MWRINKLLASARRSQPIPKKSQEKGSPSENAMVNIKPYSKAPASCFVLSYIHLGLSENRVYIPNEIAIFFGIMISKTIGFRGTLFSDTSIPAFGTIVDESLATPIASSIASQSSAFWRWGNQVLKIIRQNFKISLLFFHDIYEYIYI